MTSSNQSRSATKHARRVDPVQRVVESMGEAAVNALLSSKQFEVVYAEPYRGTEEEMINISNMCDGLTNMIVMAPVNDRLALALGVIDGCLIDNLPTQEVRTLVRTIAKKDVALLAHMPQTKAILARVLRAVNLSEMLSPTRIRQLALDVKQYQQQFEGGGL
jgi:hypothetical protein